MGQPPSAPFSLLKQEEFGEGPRSATWSPGDSTSDRSVRESPSPPGLVHGPCG